MFKKTVLAGITGLAIAGAAIAADNKPGHSGSAYDADAMKQEQALPLSEIARTLEAKGYSNVTKIEFEHGAYEVKARDDKGQRVKLYLDAATGEPIKSKRRH